MRARAGVCDGMRKSDEKEGWVNSGLRRFCNPVEASRGEKGDRVGGDGG